MADTQTIDPIPATPAANGTQAPAPAATPAKTNERMFTVTLPGGKKEVWPESKVLERAQKAEGAEAAFKKASDLEKAFANLVSQGQDPKTLLGLLTNPNAFKYDEEKQVQLLQSMLASKNPKIVDAAKRWIYENEVEPQQLTPEQKRLRELEKFEKDTKAQEQSRLEAEKQAKANAEVNAAWNRYRLKIGETIKKGNLPETTGMVRRMVQEARTYTMQGQQPDFEECLKTVRDKWMGEMTELLGKATDDELLKMIPEEICKRINAAFVNKLKGAIPVPANGEVVNGRRGRPSKDEQAKRSLENKRYWQNIGRR